MGGIAHLELSYHQHTTISFMCFLYCFILFNWNIPCHVSPSDIWRCPEIGVPPNHPFLDGIFHYKLTILGIPHSRKPPYLFNKPFTEVGGRSCLGNIPASNPTSMVRARSTRKNNHRSRFMMSKLTGWWLSHPSEKYESQLG